MIHLRSSPVLNKLPNVSQFKDDREILEELQFNKGMYTMFDPSDLPPGALINAKNAVVRYDKTDRRFGNVLYSPTAPNTNQINYLTVWSRSDNTVNLIRFAGVTVHKSTAGAWTAIAPNVTAISPSATDRFRSIIINDRFFFVDNGVDYIQEINTSTNKYDRLGDGPKAKFIAGFGGRLMAAYCGGDPNLVQWSGDGNYGEWSAATDISAGQQDLVDIGLSFADPISGLFANDNRAILLRERSIWTVTKQASATQPYYFQQAVVNRGCDVPYSACVIPDGIAFVSLRYKSVFTYYPGEYDTKKYGLGSSGDRIGLPIETLLVSQIQDTTNVTGEYDALNNEYNILIPQSSGYTVIWKYNFDTTAWSYDVITNAHAIAFLDYTSVSLAMDDLLGTMDGLSGTMDSLSTPTSAQPVRLIGMTNGDILQESKTSLTDNGVSFETDLSSKTYAIKALNCIFAEYRFYLTPIQFLGTQTSGLIDLYVSKDDGTTYTLLKHCIITASQLANPIIIKTKKTINTRRLTWKLATTDTLFSLNGSEIHYFPSGESKK